MGRERMKLSSYTVVWHTQQCLPEGSLNEQALTIVGDRYELLLEMATLQPSSDVTDRF